MQDCSSGCTEEVKKDSSFLATSEEYKLLEIRQTLEVLACLYMACNTLTPGHPSAADEAWYLLNSVVPFLFDNFNT